MASYTVTATITFDITNPSAFQAIASLTGSTGGDERDQVEAIARSALMQLPTVAERYGFHITAGDAMVETAR
jgi:hypothetical protein